MKRLYDQFVQPTERLTALRNGGRLTGRDVEELYSRYYEGAVGYAGVEPTLEDFGAWLLGNHYDAAKDWYTDCEPASIVW